MSAGIVTATPGDVQRPGPMSGEAAAWIRAVAWRDHHRRTVAECPSFYERCACQWGRCGHCAAGRHHACTHELHDDSAEHAPAYITDRRGCVVAAVWETGHRHAWTCACKLDHHGRISEQAALF